MPVVILSPGARRSFRREYRYLSERSVRAVIRFRANMKEVRRLLATFPEAGKPIGRIEGVQLRRVVMGDYVLDYELSHNAITIVTLRHGRQMDPWDMPGDSAPADYEAD